MAAGLVTRRVQVDIIISEWMGYALFYESMLDTVLDARSPPPPRCRAAAAGVRWQQGHWVCGCG